MQAVADGVPILEIAQMYPSTWARNYRALNVYGAMTQAGRDWPVETLVYWGPPGSGKSSRARLVLPDAFWLSRGNYNQTWWDGYDRHEDVVIDEFYGWCTRDFLQRVCDRYPLQLPIRGGSTNCLIRRVVITSNVHPSEWWPKIGLGAMERRLTGVVYVDYSDDYPCVKCGHFPHGVECNFTPPRGAPQDASRGPKSVVSYVAADGSEIPLF